MGTSIKNKTNRSPAVAGDAVPVDRGGLDGYVNLGTAASAATGDFDAAGSAAAAQAASQPVDSDLTAIAALTTTAFGRALLELADQAALLSAAGAQASDADLTAIAALSPANDDIIQRKAGAWTNRTVAQYVSDLGLGSVYQPLDSDLTALAALTTTAFGRGLLELADAAALLSAAGAAAASHAHAGEDVTSGTVAAARLGVMTGDSGAGGASGAVPAPGAGDAAAGKFLRADATYAVPASSGIGGSTGATDNAILRADGTGGATAQASAVSISDVASSSVSVFTPDTAHDMTVGRAYHNGSNWVSTGNSPTFIQFGGSGDDTLKILSGYAYPAGSTFTPSRIVGFGRDYADFWKPVRAQDNIYLKSTKQFGIASTDAVSTASFDVGFARVQAGVARISDGSTGAGSLLNTVLVEANTAVAASPNVLAATESGTLLTNEGTTAKNYHTLPTAVAGLQFEFIVQDADGIRIVAAAGDDIRVAGTVSGAAGYTESTTVGDAIRLVSINAVSWVATSVVGTWTTV